MTEKRTVTIQVKREITYEIEIETSKRPRDAAKEAIGCIRDSMRGGVPINGDVIHTLWTAESESGEIVSG